MSYRLIGLQTNSVKTTYAVLFIATTMQLSPLLFPTFSGAFEGIGVTLNASLENADCEGRGLTVPHRHSPIKLGICSSGKFKMGSKLPTSRILMKLHKGYLEKC